MNRRGFVGALAVVAVAPWEAIRTLVAKPVSPFKRMLDYGVLKFYGEFQRSKEDETNGANFTCFILKDGLYYRNSDIQATWDSGKETDDG